MALHRAGLGAGALDNDDSRADGDASAPLRSRPLAAQVRVDATTARERLLLDWGAAVSRLFFDISNFSKLTQAVRRYAHALHAEEFDRRWARRHPVRCRCRECGKSGAETSTSMHAAAFVCPAVRAGSFLALVARVDRFSTIARRRRAARILLARVVVFV